MLHIEKIENELRQLEQGAVGTPPPTRLPAEHRRRAASRRTVELMKEINKTLTFWAWQPLLCRAHRSSKLHCFLISRG